MKNFYYHICFPIAFSLKLAGFALKLGVILGKNRILLESRVELLHGKLKNWWLVDLDSQIQTKVAIAWFRNSTVSLHMFLILVFQVVKNSSNSFGLGIHIYVEKTL